MNAVDVDVDAALEHDTPPAPDQATPERARLVASTGVAVDYGAGTVLSLPDIALRAHEELLLVGPSGSGKTTLIHVLAGLLRPSRGSVQVAGQDLTRLKHAALERFRAAHIGLVFQDFHLVEGYTALENVIIALGAAGVPLGQAKKRAAALLGELGLGHRLGHPPKKLSTGERQRVAIARAVAVDPALLLADEPTANLDRGRAEAALDLLRAVARSRGAALVISTHDPMVMDKVAQQVRVVG